MPHGERAPDLADVADLLARAASVADALQRTDVAEVLRVAPAHLAATGLTVLLAGEARSGKSRLLNAVLGEPDRSPVGDGPTTGCPIGFTHAVAAAARVTTQLTVQDVPVDRLAELVTTACPTTTSATVGLPNPALSDLTIVDTPGLSGLSVTRRQMILDALRTADALVFTTDAGRPLSGPELAFLRRAAATLSAIVVAVSRIDLHPSYEVVLQENRAILAGDPALADVVAVAVSAATAELAADPRLDPATAALVRRRSQVDELVRLVRDHAGAAVPRVKAANAVRLVDAAVRQLGIVNDHEAAAVQDRGDRRGTLRRQYEALRLQTGDENALVVEVRNHLNRMRVRPRHRFDDAVAGLRRRFREEATTGKATDLATLPARVEAEIAAVGEDALGELTGEFARLAAHLSERLGYDRLDDFFAETISSLAVTTTLEDSDLHRSRTQSVISMLPGLRVGALVAAPTGILATLGVAAAVPLAPIALGVAAAVGIGWWTNKATSTQAQRTHLRGWVDVACSEVRAVFARVVEEQVMTVQQHVDLELPALVRARRDELGALDEQLRALARADDEERARARAAHEQRRAMIAELAAAADALRARSTTGGRRG